MRGCPDPFSSLPIAALLLVPMTIGGMGVGLASPTPAASVEPNEPRVAPPHTLSPVKAHGPAARHPDLVVAFGDGDRSAGRTDPRRALGPPDGISVGLGRNGCLTLAFTDGLVVNDADEPGPDLRLHAPQGGMTEHAVFSVSLDGIAYDGTTTISDDVRDIDLSAHSDLPFVRYLRFEDSGTNAYNPSSGTSGWDLDAVQALHFAEHAALAPGLDDTGVRQLPC